MKKMHILLLGVLPILLLLVTCGQDNSTSVSPSAVQTELTLAKKTTATGTGTIVSINPARKHGVIQRTDDGSNNLYQFSIPRDVQEELA